MLTKPSTAESASETTIANTIPVAKHPAPDADRDVRDVDAERDVQRVTERKQAGEAELEVVRQRERAVEHAGRKQIERARRRERSVEELRNVQADLRHECERDEDDEGKREVGEQLPSHALPPTIAPAKPRGRASSTTPSSSTTTMSPIPDDA